MVLVANIIALRLLTVKDPHVERLDGESMKTLRGVWNEMNDKCFRMFVKNPENSLVFDIHQSISNRLRCCKKDLMAGTDQNILQKCHAELETYYAQCREGYKLGQVNVQGESDPDWAVREVVFPRMVDSLKY